MSLKQDPILIHYVHPDDRTYCGSEMVFRRNIDEVILRKQATIEPLIVLKRWPEDSFPIFDFSSEKWIFIPQKSRPPLVYGEDCFYSGRDSTMCPTFVNFTGDKNYGNTENNIKQFAKVIYPDGDRTVKVNSLARLDLEGRIHEINDNVESAWRLWRNCHQSDNNHIGTYKYHSKMDSIMMQMRRIIDDIFVSYFYKQFKKETLDLGYYKVDSFQWLFSDKPFKHWPKHISTTSDDKSNLLIKRKILKRLFIEENTCFLKLIAIANNGSKHSYFNTTPRSKTGDSFPTLLINVENKEKPGQLKEINVNLSQLILGFTDLLNSIGNRAYILNSTGNIPNTCPSCCKFHRIKHYELDLPRPA